MAVLPPKQRQAAGRADETTNYSFPIDLELWSLYFFLALASQAYRDDREGAST